MTSIWTTLKEYIKLKTGVSKINENDTWEMFILRECQRINLSFNAGLFLELGHSIGNFIPVPQGFNVGRSNWGKWDYWGLTLYQIYQWYRDNSVQRGYYNNQALETLFRNDSSTGSLKKHLSIHAPLWATYGILCLTSRHKILRKAIVTLDLL